MYSHSHLNTAKTIIQLYDGSIPLTSWLKQFFRRDKKFGSKDRKQISHACYCFYRLGNLFQHLDVEQRLLIALFLCSDTSDKILQELNPDWNQIISLPLFEKIKRLSAEVEIAKIFPFESEISNEIDFEQFNLSFLIQPDLFLRIRPGKREKIVQQLQNASVPFAQLDNDCIQLSNQSKIDEVLEFDTDVVVQDYNSQRTIDLFLNFKLQSPIPIAIGTKLSAWDCCAASGGKSILLHDYFPNALLTVSDVRETILVNLQKRFKKAGIKNYHSFVADISSPGFSIHRKFDLVICDAPCSGSGTWSRTPEQLVFFKKEKIDYYSALQKKIVVNASKSVVKGGFFLYITCSVFKKENEEVVDFVEKNFPLQLKSMQYLKGYDKKADTLFAALFLAL
jgi:16S rRNA (cytosine967-C5)-methyltransferase